MDIEQHDFVLATFKPLREDDLKPDAKEHIGKMYVWNASWVIEEGPYEGDMAMTQWYKSVKFFGWVPLRDLEVHEAIDIWRANEIVEEE